jgi:hypothetical protein
MKKGQVSFEFLVLLGIVFLLFITSLKISMDVRQDIRLERESIYVEDMAIRMREEIFAAYNSYDGYVRKFELLSKLDHTYDYNLDFNTTANFMFVNSSNAVKDYAIPNLNADSYDSSNKSILIQKINGEVYVSNY